MNTIMGQKLGGRYQILEKIGKGGFSVTYLAEDMQRPGNPQCVVKQFKPMSTDPYALREARRLFDKEAEILETLGNHNNIPRLLAHFEEAQEFYLVQEYIEGHDLSKELLPGKKLSEPYVFKLLQDILEILIFVHQQRVIHRDIKPSTVEDFTGTLDEFKNSSIQDINNNIKEAKVIKTSEQIIVNKQGEELIYTAKDGDQTLKNLQVFTLKDEKAYVITYTAKIENYNDFIELAETMIKSFEIQ